METIAENTNLYICEISQNYSRERRAKPTDICEIKARFGSLYLAGTLKSARLNTKELWDRSGVGIQQFWLTISQDRFLFLLRCLRFDNLETKEERRQFDKLAPIRRIMG